MNVNYIIKSVCDKWGITEEEFRGPRRINLYVKARVDATKILREELKLSFASISKLIGDRHHTTAMNYYYRKD